MKQQIIRNVDGRVQGLISDYWINEDEVWKDQKCNDVYFPIHNQYDCSAVFCWNINDLNKNK